MTDPIESQRLRNRAGANLVDANHAEAMGNAKDDLGQTEKAVQLTRLVAAQLEAAYWIERRTAERLPDAFPVATVDAMFGAVLSGDSFTIRRDGKPVAVAVPVSEWEQTMREYDRLTREDDT